MYNCDLWIHIKCNKIKIQKVPVQITLCLWVQPHYKAPGDLWAKVNKARINTG